MDTRTATLKQLIAASRYPIDETAVAEAIVIRSKARRLVPGLTFRIELARPAVRSFRPFRGVLSFRLAATRGNGSLRAISAAMRRRRAGLRE